MDSQEKKRMIVSTMIDRETFELFTMIQKFHKLKRSELLRTIVGCSIMDYKTERDYHFTNDMIEDGERLIHKVQTSLSQGTHNEFIELTIDHNMTVSTMLRVIIRTLVQDYFLQHLQETKADHEFL